MAKAMHLPSSSGLIGMLLTENGGMLSVTEKRGRALMVGVWCIDGTLDQGGTQLSTPPGGGGF